MLRNTLNRANEKLALSTDLTGHWHRSALRLISLLLLALNHAGRPAVAEPAPASPGDRHWAFRPVEKPLPPAVHREDLVRTPVDRFVLQRLEEQGLQLSPPADRRMLIRRATYDLTGLPPTPESQGTLE